MTRGDCPPLADTELANIGGLGYPIVTLLPRAASAGTAAAPQPGVIVRRSYDGVMMMGTQPTLTREQEDLEFSLE